MPNFVHPLKPLDKPKTSTTSSSLPIRSTSGSSTSSAPQRSPQKMAKIVESSPPSTPAQASTNYKEAFALFDKRGNGRVSLDSLGDLLRACGQNPTLAEIKELEKGIGGDCEFFLSYSLCDDVTVGK